MENKKNIEMLDDNRIDEYMEYSIPFDDDSNENIKRKFYDNANFQNKKIRKSKLVAIIGLASVFVFSTLVYANVIDLSELYNRLWGDNQSYVDEKVVNIDMREVDDGIEARIVSVFMSNESEINVIITLKDTTGQGRITKDSRVDNYNIYSGNDDSGSSGTFRIIEFDEKTNTAVYLINSYRANGYDGEITLELNDITNDSNEAMPWGIVEDIDIYEQITDEVETMAQTEVIQNESYYMGDIGYEVVQNMNLLALDKNIMPFENIDWAEISNVGFVDNMLHIQVKEFVNGKNRGFGGIDINIDGIIYYNDIQFGFYEQASTDYKYYEYVYTEITELNQLKDSVVMINYRENGDNIPVSYTFKFDKPDGLTSNVIASNVDVEIAGVNVFATEIALTPSSVDVLIERDEFIEFRNDDIEDVYVVYKNGEIEKLVRAAISGDKFGDMYHIRVAYVPIEKPYILVDEVKEIVINGKVFGVE